MPVQQDKVKSLFLSVLDIPSAEARETFLSEQCGDDDGLRKQVLELLSHQQQLNSFLEPDEMSPTLEFASANSFGKISSYNIREKIGEGGRRWDGGCLRR
jgi:hypothetical protein